MKTESNSFLLALLVLASAAYALVLQHYIDSTGRSIPLLVGNSFVATIKVMLVAAAAQCLGGWVGFLIAKRRGILMGMIVAWAFLWFSVPIF